MIREATEKLGQREDLTRVEARAAMEELLSGSLSDPDIMAFLIALRDKGERAEELVGFAEVMRARAGELLREAGLEVEEYALDRPLLDTCGTGLSSGSGMAFFLPSISTYCIPSFSTLRPLLASFRASVLLSEGSRTRIKLF